MGDRVILHCDLNNYFASAECVDHPEWRGVPMAVCGSREERRGIVLAKNELAKTAGVQTAMPVGEALRLCPRLLTVPPHYERYAAYARQVRAIYAEYTDLVEPFGIDECWLDVTGSRRLFGDGEAVAHAIRRRVKRELGLTISVGVSFCKVMAKLGSDFKKPDAVTLLPRSALQSRVWPLPVGRLLGVGRRTEGQLAALGIFTIGQLAAEQPGAVKRRLGKNGLRLWQFANGLECEPVSPFGYHRPPESVSRSVTTPTDLETPEQIRRVLVGLAESLCSELRQEELVADMVTLSLRDASFAGCSARAALGFPTRAVLPLVSAAMQLLPRLWQGQPLRAVGIGAGRLLPQSASRQTGLLFDWRRCERWERLEGDVDRLRGRFGPRAVVRASQLTQSVAAMPHTLPLSHAAGGSTAFD